jgi:hypothetical protein
MPNQLLLPLTQNNVIREIKQNLNNLSLLVEKGWERISDGWGLTIILENLGKVWQGVFFHVVELAEGFVSVIMEEWKKDEFGDYCVLHSYPAFRLESGRLDEMVAPWIQRAIDWKTKIGLNTAK